MTRTLGPTSLLLLSAALGACAPGPGESLEDGDWPGDPSDPGDPALWPRLDVDTTDPAAQPLDPYAGLDPVVVTNDPPPEIADPVDDPTVLESPMVPLLDPPSPAATCAPAPAVTRPATCPFGRSEVVVWSARAWSVLASELAANRSECTDFYVSIPPIVQTTTVAGVTSPDGTLAPLPYKLDPRSDDAARFHALGHGVHAMAELHWASWATYRRKTGATWREIGHEFRRRMELAGYCVSGGDTWAINEAPTSVRTDPVARVGFENLVRGLTEGAPGMRAVRGAVFVWGMGHRTTNFSAYKPSVAHWLEDSRFWAQMNVGVRFWGQETYVDPTRVCTSGTDLQQHATHMDEFSMHVADLAFAAKGHAPSVNNARAYLGRAYVPLLNAVFGADPVHGYGETNIALVQMQHFVTEQVYANRQFADTHDYTDGRIGFGFGGYAAPAHYQEVAHVLAQSVEGAYAPGGTAMDACLDGTWCHCNVPGSSYHSGWSTFQHW